MKSAGQRNWIKMSTHGKKEFLSHHGFDKKLASSNWESLSVEVKKEFEANPVVKVIEPAGTVTTA